MTLLVCNSLFSFETTCFFLSISMPVTRIGLVSKNCMTHDDDVDDDINGACLSRHGKFIYYFICYLSLLLFSKNRCTSN